ncbi:MAG: SMC-Scp complex subunit ScpB [Bacteroides sp.]|nr:SMC-Scp complex subunit ScpB [Bacillota bacterium]MCM1393926.1 SMC-Scp complex subunit ScpB [[Eubacterium] siraeum]MCM1455907.1 SMC-Scp complex subunit ScpB [Bacteroides sp.]
MENIDKVVEAIIFASGTPIAKADICQKVPELTTQKLNGIVKTLCKRYSDDSGIVLAEFNGKLQFMSNPKYGDTVADVLTPLKEKELTKTLLEVLATVAYKQPITRLEIDDMRGGTNSEYALSALLKAGLVEAVGRKDTVGRPLLYGTTDEFLKKFQLTEIDDLPDYSEVLEKLMLINSETQATLFHTRSILNDENAENATEVQEEAASDAEGDDASQENIDDGIEIPDFLAGDEVEIYD